MFWTTLVEDNLVAEKYEAQLTEWYWKQRLVSLAYMAAREEMEEMGVGHIPEGKARSSTYKAYLAAITAMGIPKRKVCCILPYPHPASEVVSFFLFLFSLETFGNTPVS